LRSSSGEIANMKTLLIAAALLLFTRELVQSNSGEGGE
jgi:hypothetical protein